MAFRTILPALAAALLFGASTPLAKLLVGGMPPLWLAGLLYLGSGLGLVLLVAARIVRGKVTVADLRIVRSEWSALFGAIVSGGVLAPVLLMAGLSSTDGATASLLLNVEGVFTVAIAWLFYEENADRRIVLGMLAIVAGGVLLSWQPGASNGSKGALLIVAACAAWAVDNNLTRKVSANDAMLVACLKGLIAGACNTSLAFATSAALPSSQGMGSALLVGFLGYGLSLSLFVLALRTLGAARTGAYFSVAPLFGIAISFAVWPEAPPNTFWAAAALMALGVWLHARERHEHDHAHETMDHVHAHRHDLHHRHRHDAAWDGEEPHVHRHQHEALAHKHPHYPDVHHRHGHRHSPADGKTWAGS